MSLTTSKGHSRRAHLFPTASTSAMCYSACFLDYPLPVRLLPQTPGNTTACQQSLSNTPSHTDGLPVPPRRLATGCGFLGASISWWNTELSPAEPQRWLQIWKRSRKAGKSLHLRSKLTSFPLKRNALKLWTRMGTAKTQGESHCPVFYSLFPASSSNWQCLR